MIELFFFFFFFFHHIRTGLDLFVSLALASSGSRLFLKDDRICSDTVTNKISCFHYTCSGQEHENRSTAEKQFRLFNKTEISLSPDGSEGYIYGGLF